MTQYSIPWDGTATGDAGPYGATHWQLFHKMIFGDQAAVSARGPVWTDVHDSLVVAEHSTPEMSVDVGVGAALVDGAGYWNDALVNLAVTAADPTLNRIDRALLRLDNTNQTIRLVVKPGTPGASPTPPALQTDRSPYFEIPLYQIYVGAGVTTILDANLTDEREWVNKLASAYTAFYDISGTIQPAVADTWEDVDSTNLSLTIKTHGGPIEVWGSINVFATGHAIHIDFSYDGNRYNNAEHGATIGLVFGTYSGSGFFNLAIPLTRVNLAAGTHTIRMMWKEQTSIATYMHGTAILGVREV